MSRTWAALGAVSGTPMGFIVGGEIGARFRGSDMTEQEGMNAGSMFGAIIGAGIGAAIGAGSGGAPKQVGVGELPSNMGGGFFP